jgi:hypothetical protein
MKTCKSLVERIHAGECDNPFLPEEQDPATLVLERQSQALYAYLEALERAKSALPVRERSLAYTRTESNRRKRFRAALEDAFRMKEHAKAGLLWNRAWGLGRDGGLEQVALLYASLIELVK